MTRWVIKYNILTDHPTTETVEMEFDEFCEFMQNKYKETQSYVLGLTEKHILWIDSPSLQIFISTLHGQKIEDIIKLT